MDKKDWKPAVIVPEEKKQQKRIERAVEHLKEVVAEAWKPIVDLWERIKSIYNTATDEAEEAVIEQYNKMSWKKCRGCRFLREMMQDEDTYPVFICVITGNELELTNCIKVGRQHER